MNKVYIEYGGGEYARMFKQLGYAVVSDFNEADFVCFTGGSDVSPYVYGDAQHRTTHNDSFRDAREARLFKEIVKKKIPSVGICRGGQFLNVMNGGRMYQDVTGHCQDHLITTTTYGPLMPILVSSTHHQMMMPGDKAEILATAAITSKREWYDEQVPKSDVSDVGIEVVWYYENMSLCFQPHPEFSHPKYEGMTEYFHYLLKEYLVV